MPGTERNQMKLPKVARNGGTFSFKIFSLETPYRRQKKGAYNEKQ